MNALSICQPWAWLIANGFKKIENRTWRTHYRGGVLLHAGKKADVTATHNMLLGKHPVLGTPLLPRIHRQFLIERERGNVKHGGIVGHAEIIDCVDIEDKLMAEAYASEWFVGRYGFVMKNAEPMPFIPLTGRLGFFEVADAEVRQHWQGDTRVK